jgi:hypothetical protein
MKNPQRPQRHFGIASGFGPVSYLTIFDTWTDDAGDPDVMVFATFAAALDFTLGATTTGMCARSPMAVELPASPGLVRRVPDSTSGAGCSADCWVIQSSRYARPAPRNVLFAGCNN